MSQKTLDGFTRQDSRRQPNLVIHVRQVIVQQLYGVVNPWRTEA